MTKERLKSPRARLFIALDLPDDLREGIVEWGRRELRDPALRVVPPESLHITLAFLGYMPEKAIDSVAKVVEGIESRASDLVLGDPVAKPNLMRARVFALPVASPATISLQDELEAKLVAARLYKSEKQPFWPHVTVARVRSASRGSRQPMKVFTPPKRLSNQLVEPKYLGIRVRLYRSELNPTGARYMPLAQIELSEDGRQ
jgi:RNA 2',3'-cyclic 3'-phosphodiesterase